MLYGYRSTAFYFIFSLKNYVLDILRNVLSQLHVQTGLTVSVELPHQLDRESRFNRLRDQFSGKSRRKSWSMPETWPRPARPPLAFTNLWGSEMIRIYTILASQMLWNRNAHTMRITCEMRQIYFYYYFCGSLIALPLLWSRSTATQVAAEMIIYEMYISSWYDYWIALCVNSETHFSDAYARGGGGAKRPVGHKRTKTRACKQNSLGRRFFLFRTKAVFREHLEQFQLIKCNLLA